MEMKRILYEAAGLVYPSVLYMNSYSPEFLAGLTLPMNGTNIDNICRK
jgi:hypothetical protein